MGDLDELLERVTIEFPIPLIAEEIELGLIDYLRNEIPYDISYALIRREKKSVSDDKRYTAEFRGNIVNLRFEISGDYYSKLPIFFFKSIKFKTQEYDSTEGKEQLKLIDRVRQKTQEYFSQRPK